ncbi:MAG: cbb3-type cytochrome c oxidase subunit 3 [Devosia sp.]|nr:cbb3-type cytochrome c oxidase subunit 3 [Devosia sp.]
MDFETVQHFADSWGLLYMVVLFVGIVVFLLRPRAKQSAREASMIPFHEDQTEEKRQ